MSSGLHQHIPVLVESDCFLQAPRVGFGVLTVLFVRLSRGIVCLLIVDIDAFRVVLGYSSFANVGNLFGVFFLQSSDLVFAVLVCAGFFLDGLVLQLLKI
jgi:hypothetical protein